MASPVIPGIAAPTNLLLSDDTKAVMVEKDVYDICERIKELSPNLYILQAMDNDHCAFIIMEHCKDGVDRLVIKVKELDNRVVVHLQKMLHLPLEERVRIAEKLNYRHEQEAKEEALEDLYERIGGPMRRQLWHDGFIEHRDKSYPKRGIKK